MSEKKKCSLCKLPCEELLLVIRNVFAFAATVLFVITLLGGPHHLRGIAYFCGAAAYFTEILALTECFKKRVSLRELFMAILFCPVYVLLAFDYLK